MDRLARDEDLTRPELDRNFDLREASVRKMLNMQYQHPLHIDPKDIPDGFELKWVTATVHGGETGSKLAQARRAGWTPVPASYFPDRVCDINLDRKHHHDGYIHDRGLILHMRPKEIGDVERKMEFEFQQSQMMSIPGMYNNPAVELKVSRNEVGIMQTFKEN